MTASFRNVDYSLRPAKHAERKMLSEIFRRLRPFDSVENYAYVGFGSLWFSDFSLFHRALGIRDMTSIEREKHAQARIDANRPYSTIKMHYDESAVVLPQLDWSKKSFVWLDYDDPITTDMLLDVQTVANHAVSGTVLAISVQSQQAKEIQEAEQDKAGPVPIDLFRDRFGREMVPGATIEADLYSWKFAALSRKMFSSQIDKVLAARNMSLGTFDRLHFHPICEIEYKDNAKMTTLVGILASTSDMGTVRQCKFDTLDFLTATGKPIRIDVPVLTVREIRHLERQLPKSAIPLDYGAIPPGDADRFAEFYRYLPNFAVLEQ